VTADLAVLPIQGASNLRAVSFAGAPAKVGQRVVAIGNAGGKGGTPTAVSSSVTGLGQSITAVESIAADVKQATPSTTVHIGPTAFLGVDVTAAGTTGAVVVAVLAGTAAAAIGLGGGDTIVSLAGHAIRNPTTLSDVLQAETPGASVRISWHDRLGVSHAAMVSLTGGHRPDLGALRHGRHET
jgi:S1-C subfamily serine protease